jgi:hypothetical protein
VMNCLARPSSASETVASGMGISPSVFTSSA